MSNVNLNDLYKELNKNPPKISFEEAQISLGMVGEYNLEVMYALMIKYHLENGGDIRGVQAKIPFNGKKANKNGGILFRRNHIPEGLLNILANFLIKINSDV